MTPVYFRFDKLRLSTRQKCVPNNDPETRSWPEIFLWTEGLILLSRTRDMVQDLSKVDAEEQVKFWQGEVPAQLLELLPASLVKCSPARIVEYCRVWQSRDRARRVLIFKARRDKLNPKGELSVGGLRFDEKTHALRIAAAGKTVNSRTVTYVLKRAAEENDVRFFIRLGKALQSKNRPKDVDWTRCDPLAIFLMENWCEPLDYKRMLPALCFFTDQALADFCSAAFGRNQGNPSSAAIRQWRRRLGLKSVRSPKIRKVIIEEGEILFV